MVILENYDEAAEILLLPIVNNKNEASELSHEIQYWEAIGSLYIRQGEEKYGYENVGSITMYNPDSNIRRIPTSYERDCLEELLKKPDSRKKESKQ